MSLGKNSILVITPVKNESEHILQTIRSVVNQTHPPVAWVIVDDGSTDNTVELIRPYLDAFEWICLVSSKRSGERLTGIAEAAAFNAGLESAGGLGYDFIAKIDGDVVLERDYLEKVLKEFGKDPALGIASGCYLERHDGRWRAVEMPEYHAAGASKILRRRCFEEIGGFLAAPGWDTADEIKALYRGWKTRHYADIKFFHLRNEGSGMGRLRTGMMHGEVFHVTGGGAPFFTLKLIHRAIFGAPFILGGLYMLIGYLKALVTGKDLLVTREEARFYRGLLNRRVMGRIKKTIKKAIGAGACAGSAGFLT